MQLTISNKINYVEEANYLLFNYVNQISYEKLKSDDIKKNTNNKEQYDKRYEYIIKINDYVTEYMRFDKDRLDYFFKEIGNSKISLSNYIFPLVPEDQADSIDDYVKKAKSLNEAEIIEDFDSKIFQYYSIGKSGEERNVKSFEDLTRAMDITDISTDDKWKLIQCYLNRDSLIDEIAITIHKTIELLKECTTEISILEEDFYAYWSDYIKSNDLLQKLQDYANVSWEKSAMGTLIVPTIFRPQTISFSINEEYEHKVDVIHLGVILDYNLIFEAYRVDSERLNSSLKILSDKSKFDILMYIKNKPSYGFELANALNLSTSTISYHMSGLIAERLVKIEKDANKLYYSINQDKIKEILEDVRILLL